MPAADPRPSQAARLLYGALLPLLFAAGLAQEARADELKPFTVSYSIIYKGVSIGQATLTLVRRDGETWSYSSTRRVFFSTQPPQESIMRVTEAGVQPLTYRVGTGSSPPGPKDVQLRFDWETGHLTGVYEKAPLDEVVPPGTQDQMSIGINLVHTLVHGHEPDQVVLLDGKLPHHYRFVREKEEVIDTKIGKVPTILYSRTKAEGPELSRFWLAPSYGFVPMKVEQKDDNGTQYSLVITSIKR